MKKTILWIAAILIISGCSQKKTAEETFLGIGTQYLQFPEYLKGRVKEMHETNYWAVDQNGEITKGKPMTWTDLDSVGSLRNVIEYFDEAGNVMKEAVVDENNHVRSYLSAKYENGKLARWERFRADTLYSYYKPEFNEKGWISGGKSYRAGNDTLISGNAFSYDGKGNYTKYEAYNHKNVKLGWQEFSVDDRRNITEVRIFSGSDSLAQRFTQKYSKDKNYMTEQIVEVTKPASKVAWKFTILKNDERGNWTQVLQDVDNGKFRFVTERTYVYY